jgi:hypothetical protein
VIFADFYGPAAVYVKARVALEARIAQALNARPTDVVVRRIEADSPYTGAEVWIELSSEEQLARHGQLLAQEVTDALRAFYDADTWVLFRIVPLAHVYLNGEPRRRGLAT